MAKKEVIDVEVTKTQLEDLVELMKNSQGYLLSVTVISNGNLNHHLISSNFPELDVLKSLSKVKELAVARLEKL